MNKNSDTQLKGLYAPLSYKKASNDDLHKHTNGCGPNYLPYWIIPDNFLGVSIQKSCDIHDWMFKEASNSVDYKRADKTFLENMHKEILYKKSLFNPIRKLLSFVYYGAVRFYSTIYNMRKKGIE